MTVPFSKIIIENYEKACKDDRTEPHEEIIKQLVGIDSGNEILNLSTINFCQKTCKSLGKFLSNDTHFTELRLTDCLLQDEALKILLEGIIQNKSLTYLDLKGNNMKNEVGQALCAFLKFNRCLRHLILEWNNIGVFPEVVTAISEGLASNNSLRELVLRNNQISHVGAVEIGNALKKNSILKILDLRWNNIGLLGGRELAEALKINRSLIQLDLNGNNVSIDTLNSIERALKFNSEHQLTVEEQKRREEILKIGLRRAEEQASGQMNDMMVKLNQEQIKAEQIHRVSSSTISNLQNVLDERLSFLKSLEAKAESMEKTLLIKEKQIKDLEDHLILSKQEISDLRMQHLNILRQERDNHSEREEALLIEIRNLRDEKQQINAQIKQTNENSQIDLQKASKIWEELLNRCKETAEKREVDFKNQLLEERNKMTNQIKDWEKKEREFETRRQALQLELEKLAEKIKVMENELRNTRDELNEKKTRLKLEKEEAEERNKMMQLAREELQKNMAAKDLSERELQMKLNAARDELERRREEIGNLQIKLSAKEESERLVTQLRTEIRDIEQREREATKDNERTSTRLKEVEREMADSKRESSLLLKEKETEISKLKEKIIRQEEHWKQITEKEQQRISLLHSAITTYLQSSPIKPS